MENQKDKQFTLPKNIRQMGNFGDTYKIYVEDFVYTYVHQFLHRKKEENEVIAAVLLGEVTKQDGQEYVFVNGAQKVDFRISEEGETEENTTARQQEFWGNVYQGIKEYFSDREILGWYINLDGSGLELNSQLQQFFEATYSKGSRFLYYEDSLEKLDAFFVQEQHILQRISGYAVYYEKNPQMQEFMIAEKERMAPKPPHNVVNFEKKEEDVAQNYRAILNKLNEKPQKKKVQPVIYVAGVAVLAVVTATGITQVGNYQNLKTLEKTLQTISGSVLPGNTSEESSSSQTKEEQQAEEEKNGEKSGGETDMANGGEASTDEENSGQNTPEDTDASQTAQKPGGETSENDQSDSDTEESQAENGQSGSDAEESQAENGQSDSDAEKYQSEKGQAVSAGSTQEPVYYTVKRGDSLVSISKAMYNSTDMIDEICSLNNIENMDVIYEGQKLRMP